MSTRAQDDQLQTDALRTAGAQVLYRDVASGKTSGRPEADRLLAEVQPGDVILTWRLDRWGRSTTDLLESITALADRGVGFRTLDGGSPIDTTTASGRLLLTVLVAVASFERELLVERTLAGLEVARSRGRVGGRKPTLSAEQVAEARRMAARGEQVAAIARVLNTSRPTIYRALECSA